MLFSKETYITRRATLRQKVGSGLIVIMGNNEAPCNYPANAYGPFRQDSSFLYFFAQHREGLVGVIDADTGEEWLIGDDQDIEDIIWTGFVPSVHDLALEAGIGQSAPMSTLKSLIDGAQAKGKTVHYLPPYRHDTMIQLADLLGIHPLETRAKASVALIKAVVDMRAVKTAEEIAEIERAMAIGYAMHTAAMQAVRPGNTEKAIAGLMEGIAVSQGAKVSFNSIVSQHGEIFHGSPSLRPLEEGRLLLVDAGAETVNHYCSDNTRVTPVSGKFTARQRDIYDIVVACHDLVIAKARPGVKWLDMHLDVCRLMTERLKDLGLMKGNVEDAVAAGAHAMFLQHGLGHMMGMDVHDMEGLGQVYVGFDDEVRPSTQFGTNCLRCGRRIQPGWVLTDEPGIYFIPALIDQWRGEGLHREFINYDLLDTYRDFGGIRLEDDLLITSDGCRVLGQQIIPYLAEEVEAFVAS
ncbi:MAG: aminopeptidase P family protein [Bacteroidaceae bacterium]|nr:aminopeptidase P family protein [Bacteroidaceae bacterium]MBR4779279.1 aminopeptidase P family protein [Bacteroidaceae bacterium]